MKLARSAFAAAIAWSLCAAAAQAQVPQASAARPASFDYYYYQAAAQPSPSDQPGVAIPPDTMKQGPVQGPAGGHICSSACDCPPVDACPPWRLFCQKECGWNVYGHVAGGIMTNFHNPPDHFNGPIVFSDRDYGQFNQFYAILERTIDTGGCGWDWGGRVDLLYGSDYVFTMATGLELDDDGTPKWNIRQFPTGPSNPEYGLALPQAYLEFGYNDLSLKLGHLYTATGYEVVPNTGNFFYTHAYTHQYGEPFTHTGAMATYKYSETTTLLAGIFNGWDAFDRLVDTGAGHGGVLWDGGEGLTLAWNFIFSPNEPVFFGANAGRLTNRNLSTLVIGYTFGACDQWQYVFQNDLGWQHNANGFGDPNDGINDSAEWYGINQYLFYTINDCWKAGLRAEWFRDDDGARVTGLRNPNNLIFGDNFAGDFFEISAGLNWSPSANLRVRPELRYDWANIDVASNNGRPYAGETRVDQWIAGFDVIYLW